MGRRRRASPARGRDPAAAFTLIEIMAVVVLFALFAAIAAPRVAALGGRELRLRAQDLASQLEMARQRSVVTGVRHRVWIDLENPAYRVEWLPPLSEEEKEERQAEAPGLPTLIDFGDPEFAMPERREISLVPPRQEEREWQPLPGESGRLVPLEDRLMFEGLETAEGWIERGDASVDFDTDGTATPADVHLTDEDGRAIVLRVLPLADGVRITDAS